MDKCPFCGRDEFIELQVIKSVQGGFFTLCGEKLLVCANPVCFKAQEVKT